MLNAICPFKSDSRSYRRCCIWFWHSLPNPTAKSWATHPTSPQDFAKSSRSVASPSWVLGPARGSSTWL